MITLTPSIGGVSTMARVVGDVLTAQGYDVTAAHRLAYSTDPKLSVPIWAAAWRRPAMQIEREARVGLPRYGVGTWLPEFEWAHHQPWQPWRSLIERFDRHVVVTGNALPAFGLAKLGLPVLNWVATAYLADRIDRFRTKPLVRRLFDRVLNRPVCERQERFVLERTHVLALSDYTARDLRRVAPKANVRDVLRMPVPATVERPRQAPASRPVIGFAGRLTDPRKNMRLLFDAFRLLRQAQPIELRLAGDVTAEWARANGAADLLDDIVFLPPQQPAEMDAFYDQLDLFVIPSRQEGLAIVGIEAMARGLPVVSTRCGGPEDYVVPGQTGYLTGFGARELADTIGQALQAADYVRLSANALQLLRDRHGAQAFTETLMANFATLYG